MIDEKFINLPVMLSSTVLMNNLLLAGCLAKPMEHTRRFGARFAHRALRLGQAVNCSSTTTPHFMKAQTPYQHTSGEYATS